jgi:hypothetical protein
VSSEVDSVHQTGPTQPFNPRQGRAGKSPRQTLCHDGLHGVPSVRPGLPWPWASLAVVVVIEHGRGAELGVGAIGR